MVEILSDAAKTLTAEEAASKDKLLVGPIKKTGHSKKLVIIFVIFTCWFAILQLATSERYAARVKVSEQASQVNAIADSKVLDYGAMLKGSGSLRFLTIANKGDHPVYIQVLKLGNIGDIMKLEESGFRLGAKEYKDIGVSVQVPQKTDRSAYDGALIIVKLPEIF
jgi:hypothetical protein